jgi:uncharacterized protein YndB with AHSA1/START domain
VAAVVRRVLPAVPDVVFDEWLKPEALADWMCPRPARCLAVSVRPWVGGEIRFDIEDSGVRFVVHGRFRTLDRPHRLEFTWSCSTWPDPTVRSVVTVTLEPEGAACTLMTIEHTLLPPGTAERHAAGWRAIAEQFAAALSR